MEQVFTLDRRVIGTVAILYLDGPLRLGYREATTGQGLSEIVRQMASDGACQIAIDLRGLVKTPDSSGLGELVAAQTALRGQGGALVLVNVPPKLRQVMAMMGLHQLFRIVDTEEEAVGLLGKGAEA